MGIYDRDYLRSSSRGGIGALGGWSCTTGIIIVLALVFVVDVLIARAGGTLDGPLERGGFFSLDRAVFHGQVWRLLTFPFIHATVGSLALNILVLFFFAPVVEEQWGARRFLVYSLLCCLAGAGMYIILWAIGLIITDATIPLVGATGGVLGVLVAAARFTPDVDVPVVYVPFPVKLRAIVWVVLIGGIIILLRRGIDAGPQAAHVGGVLMGFLLTYNENLLNALIPRARRQPTRRRPKRSQKDWSRDLDR